MECPNCKHELKNFMKCKNCNYIFKSEDYDYFIKYYTEKYANIQNKFDNNSNTKSKIIFKNIDSSTIDFDDFKSITYEEFAIRYFQQKGFNAFLQKIIIGQFYY